MGNHPNLLLSISSHISHHACLRCGYHEGVFNTAVTGRISCDNAVTLRVLAATTVELEFVNGVVASGSVGTRASLLCYIILDSNASNDCSLNRVAIFRIDIYIKGFTSRC